MSLHHSQELCSLSKWAQPVGLVSVVSISEGEESTEQGTPWQSVIPRAGAKTLQGSNKVWPAADQGVGAVVCTYVGRFRFPQYINFDLWFPLDPMMDAAVPG